MAESQPAADGVGIAMASDPEYVPLKLVAGNLALVLDKEGLSISENRASHGRRKSRFCGIPISLPEEFSAIIPYYNILWASRQNGRIVIEWAEEKDKGQLQRATMVYSPISESPEDTERFINSLHDRAYGQVPRRRQARVLINPHAGPGHATRIWEKEVKPIFEAARMILDVTITSRAGEGLEICETLDVDAYDVVVICSGDGLAYEAINGLGKRADARTALQKVAIAHIPCGSGNAMNLNLTGSNFPGTSAVAVVKGARTSMDLMSITQGDRRTLSFLSQSVGIIAEADLATEHLRWMGALRFDYGVVRRVFSKTAYPCDIAMKVEIENKDEVKAHYKRIRGGEGSQKNDKTSISAGVLSPDEREGLPPLRFGTVNDELPADWEVKSFPTLSNFYCGNMAWMAPKANFFPAACINDGLMDMITVDANVPVKEYVGLMLSLDGGPFFDNALVSYRKVAAYRFTPREQPNGYISIDGEHVPFEPFQVEIHAGLGTVLSKSGKYEAYGPPNWEAA